MAEEDQEQIDFDRALENFDEEELQEGGSDEDSQQAAIWEYEEQYGRVCNDAQSGKRPAADDDIHIAASAKFQSSHLRVHVLD